MSESYKIRSMSAAEVDDAVAWAAAEGWNPGDRDAQCFATVDPAGFLGGFVDGRMTASISVVNYDDSFAFLGFYIVTPEQRGKGYGYALWKAGMEHAGDRVIGLDGVVDQQENYTRSGFEFAYCNVRYGGVPTPLEVSGGPEIRRIGAPDAELLAFDAAVFPAPRPAFLEAWVGTEGHVAFASYDEGKLTGYAVARPSVSGTKIGPLFAVDAVTARALAAEAVRAAAPGDIFLDVPEPNGAAVALAEELGLAPVFETARMYRGAAPQIDLDRIFGVTSFELG
ncbi:MAG: GNAT family N-acetyltransferase [Nisaea sp.]|uniref:GNAT family N-acetyltransferase n=1 Tax=Nisaea sp. TaxID=2024842 RepID=UPI00329972BA